MHSFIHTYINTPRQLYSLQFSTASKCKPANRPQSKHVVFFFIATGTTCNFFTYVTHQRCHKHFQPSISDSYRPLGRQGGPQTAAAATQASVNLSFFFSSSKCVSLHWKPALHAHVHVLSQAMSIRARSAGV